MKAMTPHPLTIDIPAHEIDDLRSRLRHARWVGEVLAKEGEMTTKRRGSHPERSEIAAQIAKQGGVVIDEPGIYWEIPKATLDAFLERLGVILADQVLADFAAKQRERANPDPCPQTESATYTAADVAAILGIPRSTVYERARLEPERLGVIRLGRSVRFRRTVIDAFVRGHDC